MPTGSGFLRAMRPVLVAVTCLALAAPALAVDGGGNGGSTTGGGGTPASTSSGSSATTSSGFDLNVAFATARSQIKSEKWKSAIATLKTVIAADPSNADALNLMGYSLRKSGDTAHALGFYQKALKINPKHTQAHEYLGELYVETGNRDKAKTELKTIETLCGNKTCEEYKDLAEALGA